MQLVARQEPVHDFSSIPPTNESPSQQANHAYFDLRVFEHCMQWMTENASNPNIWKALGAIVVIGVVIVAATGPTTCSTFYVTNDLDETLYISQLTPYSAKYANKYNHPVWNPKSWLSSGVLEISKGYTSEVKLRVDEYFTFNDDYFYLHMNANGKPEDFYVTGRKGMQLKPSLSFFSCKVLLQKVDSEPNNSTSLVQSEYLRGSR